MSREIYGVLIGAVTITAVLLPLPIFLLIVGLLSFLMAGEVSGYLGVKEIRPTAFFSPLFFYVDRSAGILYVFILGLALGYRRWDLDSAVRSVFLLTYTGFFPSYLIAIKEEGTRHLLIFLLTLWASDVAAYYVGRRWGRRSLFPKISPRKTVEGFLGGLLAGVLVFTALSDLSLFRAVIVSILFITAGVVGDYFKSFLKRHFGIKDFSSVLGGHGGFTDRFDSVVFSAPLYYLLLFRL
ncbi:MAG: phosphatidate cytidylyltransferase [Aquificota bacterium]|nr:phosphatidate cytidylyltransferase [Aquificota bacterium]